MEWTAVTVLIALVGLGAAVVKPIVSLTQSITRLTVVVEGLRQDMDEERAHNRDGHRKLWEHNDRQDGQLSEHERRIGQLECQ